MKQTQLLAKNGSPRLFTRLEDIYRNSSNWKSSRIAFRSKLNRVWTSKFVTELLDSDPEKITFKILSLFEQFQLRAAGHQLWVAEEATRTTLEDPVVKAMLDEGLLFVHAFETTVRFCSAADYFHSIDYAAEIRAKLGFTGRMRYYRWRYHNGFFFFRIARHRMRYMRTDDQLEPKRLAGLEWDVYGTQADAVEDVEFIRDPAVEFATKPWYSFFRPSELKRLLLDESPKPK